MYKMKEIAVSLGYKRDSCGSCLMYVNEHVYICMG
jgi:hypothetical protein